MKLALLFLPVALRVVKKVVLLLLLAASILITKAQNYTVDSMDGVSYEVRGSKIVSLHDAGNCPDWPNVGEFRRETRHYSRYSKGHKIKDWIESHDVFIRCREP
jgi:hypothetical protein